MGIILKLLYQPEAKDSVVADASCRSRDYDSTQLPRKLNKKVCVFQLDASASTVKC